MRMRHMLAISALALASAVQAQAPAISAERGKSLYQKNMCFTCHGTSGRGDGPAGLELNPRPRNFTTPRFHELRTDGELFWVIRNGSPGTRMFSYSPSVITEDEAWKVIHYLRTLPNRSPT